MRGWRQWQRECVQVYTRCVLRGHGRGLEGCGRGQCHSRTHSTWSSLQPSCSSFQQLRIRPPPAHPALAYGRCWPHSSHSLKSLYRSKSTFQLSPAVVNYSQLLQGCCALHWGAAVLFELQSPLVLLLPLVPQSQPLVGPRYSHLRRGSLLGRLPPSVRHRLH